VTIPTAEAPAVDRFRLHTSICASCARVHRLTLNASKTLVASIVILLALGVLAKGTMLAVVAALLALAAGLGYVVVRAIRRRFE
jgi:hypothetical protein